MPGSATHVQALPEPLGLIQGLQVLQANGNPGLMLPLTLTALTSLSILALSFCHSNAGELLEVAPDAFAGSLQVGRHARTGLWRKQSVSLQAYRLTPVIL
jgi:hypothetical protein